MTSMKVGLVSLGCPKNQVDAEILLSAIHQGGYPLVEDAGMADIAIINTCGFIQDAKQESIDEILELCRLKEEGRIRAIVVTGCLAQRYANDIMEQLPEVDAVVTLGRNKDITSILQTVCAPGYQRQLFDGDKYDLPLSGCRVLGSLGATAYLKISEGCSNCCAYCAIPSIRGRFRSRTMEDIVSEARILCQKGVRELVVVAQDVTKYGLDLYGELKLPDLLDALCQVEGAVWIRLLYCYPECITDRLIECIRRQKKVLPYLDIPMQHCDGDILKAMNRKGDEAQLRALVEKLRREIPGLVLRTTMIAGFPGEGEEQFTALAQFCKDMAFDRMGCFAYSQEEGTLAAKMEGQIDEDVKLRRQTILSEAQALRMEQSCQSQVGKTYTVLVEGYDRYAGYYFGRSYMDAPEIDGKIFYKASKPQRVGDFVEVEITDSMDCDLLGKWVANTPIERA